MSAQIIFEGFAGASGRFKLAGYPALGLQSKRGFKHIAARAIRQLPIESAPRHHAEKLGIACRDCTCRSLPCPFLEKQEGPVGGLLPLLFMLLVVLLVRNAISSATAAAGAPAAMMDAARDEMMKQISIGMGAYLSTLEAIYLALLSVKKFLVVKANG